ncbi:hypothetical protein MJL48_35265, partial [Salmonella enterica subsp. enterica serovar Kentucky]|nr:hypothetical protein [Salmonella enterica subsp. enterica serovar Kentucky]
TVIVLPIGIGQLGKDTPINWTTKVERKKAGPTWTPTAKMHAENHQPLKLKVRADVINTIGADTIHAPAQQFCRPLGLIDGIH